MNPSSRIIHISHNDLDGYASQFIVSRTFYNTLFYNCDYKDIDFTISQALTQIKMEVLTGKPPILLIITDINISLELAGYLERKLKAIPTAPQLLLLDHHATGQDCANKFPWYQLDTSSCATRLTYQWVSHLLEPVVNDYLDQFSSLVNVADLWLTNDERFNKANLMADLIFEKNPITIDMGQHNRNYIFHLIDHVFKLIQQQKNIMEIEKNIYDIRLDYLHEAGLSLEIINDKNLTLEGKYQELILQYICKKQLPTMMIENYKVAIFYRWQGTTFQHVSSKYLDFKKDIDFAMRVGSNARLSIRSRKENIDVGQLSRKYFSGGGHPQAAGGILPVREIKSEKFALKIIKQVINEVKATT